MLKGLNKSFTLIEILIVVVVISFGLMSVLIAVDYALSNVQSVRQKVIAINLAREGMEGVYQIRDTNRLSGPAEKEECRLDMNPFVNDNAGCLEDSWMGSGNYILQKILSGNQQSFYLSGGLDWNNLDLSDGVGVDDRKFALCLSSGDLREACPGNNGIITYFRQIHGEGLFYKDSNTTGGDYLNCTKGSDFATNPNLFCYGNEAKEYRFCSKVAYIGEGKGEVELCGLITNFSK